MTASTARDFEGLVRRILIAKGFGMKGTSLPGADPGFDFMATEGNDEWAVEVKYYRTDRAQATLLDSAASRLIASAIVAEASKAMLVVTCIVPLTLRESIEDRFSLRLVDRTELVEWAAQAPELFDELEAMLESVAPIVADSDAKSKHSSEKSVPKSSPPQKTDGSKLAARLGELDRGKNTWKAYEKLCDEILRYLFPLDLHGWHQQQWTDDDLNRFDYVCRIRPTTDFWRFLIEHLGSRYILFEFKNYTKPITQGQILTTEKYLLERALRRVAIVLSRVGAANNAIAMAQGAMRENGKLLLVLDDEKVREMLLMKDRGDDPTDLLFDLTDEFLMSLPR